MATALAIFFDIAIIFLDLVWYVIIAGIILSWLLVLNVVNRHNQIVWGIWDGINRMTEPLYRPIRRMLPNTGAVDLAPLLVLIVLSILRYSVVPRLAVGILGSV